MIIKPDGAIYVPDILVVHRDINVYKVNFDYLTVLFVFLSSQ